jgi:DNA-binding NarL/FixJ family response regulator
MRDPVKVTVVATDPMLEAGARSALLGQPDVEVVAVDQPAAVAVAIVDVVDARAVATVRATRAGAGRPAVVVVAAEVDPAQARLAIEAGARGLLCRREATPQRLARTVLAAAGGDCTIPPEALAKLLDEDPAPAQTGWHASGLTERERAVLRLIADGHETSEIARTLSYSQRTVTGAVHDITRRFRLRNRAHAVAYALRAGLL